MKTTDYVSYPIALALKKAGFDYPCYFFYTRKDSPDDHVYSTTSEEAPIDYNRSVYAGCSMPTLAQAQKWLREEWGLIILVGMTRIDDWFYGIYDKKGKCLKDDGAQRDCYESALSAGIAAALKLIEKKGE